MTHINHRVESRKCIKCGEVKDIIQRHNHATNTCDDCQRERAKHYQRASQIKKGKRIGVMGRFPYPGGGFDTSARAKFYRLKSELLKCKDRKEWLPIIIRNLDTTLNDSELMLWIKSTKDDDKPKKQKRIETDYPDTRYMDWDEYERGLGEEDVDS
jgi:hypothetical protein